MSKIDLYIKPDNNTIKYIVEIQKFDKMKSIGDIRNAISNNTPVLTHDLIYHDDNYLASQGLDDHKYNLLFLDLINHLIDMGADVTIKENDEVISLELLANSIESSRIIAEQVRENIDREAEED